MQEVEDREQTQRFSISSLFFPYILFALLLPGSPFSFSLKWRNLLCLLGQSGLGAIGEITLSEPFTGFDNLDNVDPLLEQHDGSGDDD
jgi:hypothetical protein